MVIFLLLLNYHFNLSALSRTQCMFNSLITSALIGRMMGRDPSSTNFGVLHSRRGDNLVHPGGALTPTPGERTAPPPLPVNTVTLEFRPFKRWFSWLVPSLVVVNIVLFVLTMYLNDCPKHLMGASCIGSFLGRFSFQPRKENPFFGPSSSSLSKMGALEVDKVVHRHQVWRLLSCMWLQAGVIHVLVNMMSLIFIGIRLEQEFGFDTQTAMCQYCYWQSIEMGHIFRDCSNWISVCDIWSWRKFIVCSIHTIRNLYWCFWCTIWLTRKRAIRALSKLDNIH